MHASRGPFFTCPRRCALAEGCKNEPQHAGISACISGSVLHLSPEVRTCRRLQKRTAARRYKCMHLGVRSSPVPGGVHLQKAANTNSSTQVFSVHASRGPFFTCLRRCALAEGCRNEPQHAGISACISGSLLHLSPQMCACRRLQKRTAARRCKIMHFRVRSSPVPGGVHLQKAAKTNSSTRAFT